MHHFWEQNNRTHVKWLNEFTFTIILPNYTLRILFLSLRYQSALIVLSVLRTDISHLKIHKFYPRKFSLSFQFNSFYLNLIQARSNLTFKNRCMYNDTKTMQFLDYQL